MSERPPSPDIHAQFASSILFIGAASQTSTQRSAASSGLHHQTGAATTDNPQDRSPRSDHWPNAAPSGSFPPNHGLVGSSAGRRGPRTELRRQIGSFGTRTRLYFSLAASRCCQRVPILQLLPAATCAHVITQPRRTGAWPCDRARCF